MSAPIEMHPGLAEFLATPEGTTVGREELPGLTRMERILREGGLSNLRPRVRWERALIATRITAKDVATPVSAKTLFDAHSELLRTASNIAFSTSVVVYSRSAEYIHENLVKARGSLQAARAALDAMERELALAEAEHAEQRTA